MTTTASTSRKIGIFIFRRDLRLVDNVGLIYLSEQCDIILPVFFLDHKQIKQTSQNKHYYSENAVQFMCESLDDLNKSLRENHNTKLYMFYGDPQALLDDILSSVRKQSNRVVVGWNADYSPYSKKRDNGMKIVCEQHGAEVIECHDDFTLINFENLVKSDGSFEAYKQFGAFFKNSSKNAPRMPSKNANLKAIFPKGNEFEFAFEFKRSVKTFYKENNSISQNGGRTNALKKLSPTVLNTYKDYNTKRDTLTYNTTNLSAALNFGCVSIREVYHAVKKTLGENCVILKQLYWRDFYLAAVRYLPNANDWKRHVDIRYEKLDWKNTRVKEMWERLINCRTGFLLVDAGMNEMKTSGFLHNRLRMIIGVFWTKYLQIDPRHPEYGSQVGFSKYLVDAIGPSQNLMNHRWIVDFDYPGKKFSAPGAPLSGRPMDISNKMIKKWDPDCEYIKKWLPHLKDIPSKELFRWDTVMVNKWDNIHPAPMFEGKEKYKEWIELCKQ